MNENNNSNNDVVAWSVKCLGLGSFKRGAADLTWVWFPVTVIIEIRLGCRLEKKKTATKNNNSNKKQLLNLLHPFPWKKLKLLTNRKSSWMSILRKLFILTWASPYEYQWGYLSDEKNVNILSLHFLFCFPFHRSCEREKCSLCFALFFLLPQLRQIRNTFANMSSSDAETS